MESNSLILEALDLELKMLFGAEVIATVVVVISLTWNQSCHHPWSQKSLILEALDCKGWVKWHLSFNIG